MTEQYPDNTVQLGPYTGGVNYALPPEQLPYNTLSLMNNVEIGGSFEAKKRNGIAPYASIAAEAGTPDVLAIGQHRFSSSTTRVWAVMGDTFLVEESAGSWTDRTNSKSITASATNLYDNTNAAGTLIITSATDGMFKHTAGVGLADAGVSGRFTTAKICIYWDGVLWYFNTDNDEGEIWYSDNDDIEAFGANSFFVADAPITGVAFTSSFLAVHTADNGIVRLTPTGDANVRYARDMLESVGTVAFKSLVKDSNGIHYFVRDEGIFSWDGGLARKISQPLDGSRFWDNVVKGSLNISFAVHYPNKHRIGFLLPYSSGTVPNREIIFDYQYGIWMGPNTDFSRLSGALIDRLPHYGGSSDGLLHIHDTGTSDDSSAIKAWADTGALPPEGIEHALRWLAAFFEFDRQSVDVDVGITTESRASIGISDVLATGDVSDALVTEFTIGVSAIAGSNTTFVLSIPLDGWDSGVKIRFENQNADQPFAMRRIVLEFEDVGIRLIPESGVLV